jgi:protein-tyrosine-phosphatase
MNAALLDRSLAELGVDAQVRSAGIRGDGQPATAETVRLLAERGIDVSNHRSRRVDRATAAASDLIVTAEHDHVVYIAGESPELFRRTFTLLELLERGEQVGQRQGAPIEDWLDRVGDGRATANDYLDAGDSGAIADLADPTGQTARHWLVAITDIESHSRRLATLLS